MILTQKICFVIVFVVATAYAKSLDEWKLFKETYNKHYENENQEQIRMKVFYKNLEKIHEHNKLYKSGKVGFKIGVNQFADLLQEEYQSMFTNNNFYSTKTERLSNSVRNDNKLRDVPDSIDWRDLGAVTPVRSQNMCAAFTFGALDALIGRNFVAINKLIDLSVQQLIDCITDGCTSGTMESVYDYIKQNKGIDTADSYPFEDGKQGVCRFNISNVGATCSGYVNLASGDETLLKKAVSEGPVAVVIDASRMTFQTYVSGIYKDEECSSNILDHGVLIVGYGSQNGADYWIVKNSWGVNWGEDGYIRIARNVNNMCGIATHALYPTV